MALVEGFLTLEGQGKGTRGRGAAGPQQDGEVRGDKGVRFRRKNASRLARGAVVSF